MIVALIRGDDAMSYRPVEPNPPLPRAVDDNDSTPTRFACVTGAMTI